MKKKNKDQTLYFSLMNIVLVSMLEHPASLIGGAQELDQLGEHSTFFQFNSLSTN